MLPMTLTILTTTIWDLQKHLSKIDAETIYHLLIMNNMKRKQKKCRHQNKLLLKNVKDSMD